MPFDLQGFPPATHSLARNRRRVAIWLFCVSAMVLVMVALGGATRLTGSGLSIMEWAPLSGALPPLSAAEWQRLFGLYQQIPQYTLLNSGLGLDGFKEIFWLEWAHRLWGRLIGLAFVIPLAVLWVRGSIERPMRLRLFLLFLAGGAQGAVGWFMVASGFFPDTTAVAPWRLVLHLGFALGLYAALVWTGMSQWRAADTAPAAQAPASPYLAGLARTTLVLLVAAMLAGGFVAGNRAGWVYNSFPLMDGQLVPEGYGSMEPWLRNLTSNAAAVQFNHRLLTTLAALAGLATAAYGLARRPPRALGVALVCLAVTLVVQYSLGIATLLHQVPLALGTAHQTVAVLVLTAALAVLHLARPARGSAQQLPAPMETQ